MFATNIAGPGQRSRKWPYRPYISRFYMRSGQVIGSQAWGAGNGANVAWDTIVRDEVGAISGNTTFVTPYPFTRVKFSGHHSWASSNTGNRWFWLTMNGLKLFEESTSVNTSLNECGMGWTMIWWNTVLGDKWILQVGQNTGGNLTYSPASNGPGQAWWQAEWGF